MVVVVALVGKVGGDGGSGGGDGGGYQLFNILMSIEMFSSSFRQNSPKRKPVMIEIPKQSI